MSQDEIRLSQLIMMFGPGAMVDLPNRSVVIGGLPLWKNQARQKTIDEPRLQQMLERALKQQGRLAEDKYISLRQPPLAEGPDGSISRDIPALIFPLWFVLDAASALATGSAGSRRRMVHWRELDWKSGKYKGEGKAQSVTPIRFVGACQNGHLQDIDWRWQVHRGKACRSPMWLEDRGTSADPKDLSISCECGARIEFENLFASGVLGKCQGYRPWLGDTDHEDCTKPLKLLIRGATNAYFPQVASVISLPTASDRLVDLLSKHLSGFSTISSPAEIEVVFRFNPALAREFEDYTHDEMFSKIQTVIGGQTGDSSQHLSPKHTEFDVLASGQTTIGQDTIGSRLFARTLERSDWMRGSGHEHFIRRIIAVHRLREVLCLYGFTRLEPASVASDGSLEDVFLAVEGASLGEVE